MKLVIFAGGLGTRISEESDYIPKPMVKIGKNPILWHIIKYYSVFGFSDFIICGGYKMSIIKKYFKNLKKLVVNFN
jgi:glucose-1-phosphate cytidylyltransferase